MKGSTPTVALTLLVLGGILAFSPLSETWTREGHQLLWVIEAAWFLWEHKSQISKAWSAVHGTW